MFFNIFFVTCLNKSKKANILKPFTEKTSMYKLEINLGENDLKQLNNIETRVKIKGAS